jgi:RNA polymerase sigma-70 factor (ECF subfamily)
VYDWPRIVEEHGPVAYRIARRILGHAADAEDVCQEVFAEVHRLAANGTVENLPGLIRRLSGLRSLDQLRRRKPTSPLGDMELAGRHEGPTTVAMAKELAVRLRVALAQLPEQQAAAFALRYFENLSNRQIADCLNTSPSAVSTALSKARDTLGERLKIWESEE